MKAGYLLPAAVTLGRPLDGPGHDSKPTYRPSFTQIGFLLTAGYPLGQSINPFSLLPGLEERVPFRDIVVAALLVARLLRATGAISRLGITVHKGVAVMDPSLLPTGLPKLRPLRVLIVEDDLDTAASMALPRT